MLTTCALQCLHIRDHFSLADHLTDILMIIMTSALMSLLLLLLLLLSYLYIYNAFTWWWTWWWWLRTHHIYWAAFDRFLALTNCAIAGRLGWFGSWIGLIERLAVTIVTPRGDFWGGRGGFKGGNDDGTWIQWGRDSLGEQSCYSRALLVLRLVPNFSAISD